MRSPRTGWAAAAVAVLLAAGLVSAEVSDRRFRLWWLLHPLTASIVGGVVVLLITSLVVNQVVLLRQVRDRSRAIAAQAGIMSAQAVRTSKAVADGLRDSEQRDAAVDEFRTYMMMLLVGAPLLIDARQSRTFLEEAQALGAEMARSLRVSHKSGPDTAVKRLRQAADRVRDAATPLLAPLNAAELRAAGDDTGTGTGTGNAGSDAGNGGHDASASRDVSASRSADTDRSADTA